MNAKNNSKTHDIVLTDLETTAVETAQVLGGKTQTAGGGNTSIWGKIKSLAFGVDASFYD